MGFNEVLIGSSRIAGYDLPILNGILLNLLRADHKDELQKFQRNNNMLHNSGVEHNYSVL